MKRTVVVFGLSALLALPVVALSQQTSPPPGTSGTGTPMEQQQRQTGQPSQQGEQALNHEQIQQVQKHLKDAGFDPGPIDGILGESTRAAVREFQQKHGLPQTGHLDETTRQQLMSQAPHQAPGMQAPRESTPGSAPSGTSPSSPGTPSGAPSGR